MFCNKCGSAIEDDSAFCGSCGVPVGSRTQAVNPDEPQLAPDNPFAPPPEPATAPAPTVDAVFSQQAYAAQGPVASQGAQAQQTPAPKKSRVPIIVGIVCAVVVIAIVVAAIFFMKNREFEQSHEAQNVQVSFSFAEYPEGGIYIPINITGTDLDGGDVNVNVLATQSGFDVDLLRGYYEMQIAGNPVTGAGKVFSWNGEPLKLTVDEDGYRLGFDGYDEQGRQLDVLSAFDLKEVKPADVTDAQISSIEAWMKQDGMNVSEGDKVIAAVKSNVEQARAAAKLEAEKQAALDANPSYVGGTSVMNQSQVAQLTGTVHYENIVAPTGTNSGYVCWLQLPNNVTFDGSQYGAQTTDRVVLPNSFSQYAGKVITISASYVLSATASIPENSISMAHTSGVQLVRVF